MADKKKPIPPAMLEASRRLRRTSTPAEKALWAELRHRRLVGYKFRRQVVIGWYIADFYCHDYKFIIELDGAYINYPAFISTMAFANPTLKPRAITFCDYQTRSFWKTCRRP